MGLWKFFSKKSNKEDKKDIIENNEVKGDNFIKTQRKIQIF